MNTKFREHLLSLMLLSLLLQACGAVGPAMLPGDVLSTQPGTVVMTIENALAGTHGTFILANENGLYTFLMPLANGWSFVTIDSTGANSLYPAKGNFTSATSMSELVKALLATGWRNVLPTEVPKWMTKANVMNWLTGLQTPIITIISLPGGAVEGIVQPEMLREVRQ